LVNYITFLHLSVRNFPHQSSGAVFTKLTLLFFFEDGEGFAGEIGVICIPGVENELKFVALK